MRICLRQYTVDDLEPLVRIANDPDVAANMRDVFPYPYTRDDGLKWIELATGDLAEHTVAVEVDGEFAGGAGLGIFKNEARITAEIGYWLGQKFWGRGIATAVVHSLVPWSFDKFPEVTRLQACVYNSNPASARVLEKNGFELEGVMRRSITKGGRVLDQHIYALFRET